MQAATDMHSDDAPPAPLAPLVLVHGLLGDFEAPEILAAMSAFEVFAPALLGYGDYRNIDPQRIDLAAQAQHLMQLAHQRFNGRPFHLVGHSIGGVVAALMADDDPHRILSLTNIEGNFTLQDAFWSAAIARMTPQQAAEMLQAMRGNPQGWLLECGIAVSQERVARAAAWLERQPASTLQAMAASVVAVTGEPACAALLQRVFARLPVALLAGARSRKDWRLPLWAERAAAELTLMDHAGHMMMLDDPSRFGLILGDILSRQALRAGPQLNFS